MTILFNGPPGRPLAVIGLLLLSSGTPAIAAQLNVQAWASMLSQGGAMTFEQVIADDLPGVSLVAGVPIDASVSSGVPVGLDTYFVQSQAKADYGTLGVSAQSSMLNASTDADQRTRQALGKASSTWTDTVTIGGATTGSWVTVRADMVIDIDAVTASGLAATSLRYGMITFNTSNQPVAGWCIVAAGGLGATDVAASACPGSTGPLHVGRNQISFDTQVQVGSQQTWTSTLYAEAQVFTDATGSNDGDALADAFHTAHAYYSVVTPGATLAWASGHDYTAPPAVPEPGTYALILAGLGLVAVRAGRRG